MQGTACVCGQSFSDITVIDNEEVGGDDSSLGDSFQEGVFVAQLTFSLTSHSMPQETLDLFEYVPIHACCQ